MTSLTTEHAKFVIETMLSLLRSQLAVIAELARIGFRSRAGGSGIWFVAGVAVVAVAVVGFGGGCSGSRC